MKKLIIHHHKGKPNGTLTSIIDLYLNLRSFDINVELKIICGSPINQMMFMFRDNAYFGDKSMLQSFTKDTKFEADVVICSTKMLNDIKTYDIEINCYKMVLLDSLDVMKAHCKTIPMLESPCDDTILLCNEANQGLTDIKSDVYYHKFNQTRLDTIQMDKSINYNRLDKLDKQYISVGEDVRFENIGKSIFEGLYCKSSVFYHGSGTYDGLYYYLKLFNVDATQDHMPLMIEAEEVKDKLFMKKDDLIMRHVCII